MLYFMPEKQNAKVAGRKSKPNCNLGTSLEYGLLRAQRPIQIRPEKINIADRPIKKHPKI